MNETFIRIVVAMIIPAVAVVVVVLVERKSIRREEPIAEVLRLIPEPSAQPVPAQTRWQRLWSQLKGRPTL